jgi:hypothetical protein
MGRKIGNQQKRMCIKVEDRESYFDIIENNEESFKEYSKRGWGQSVIEMKMSDIEELLKGKAIAFDDGEYTNVIYLRKEDVK